jgi:hypothetical protein
MAKSNTGIVTYDPATLPPAASVQPSKHSAETIGAYTSALSNGQGAGDGVTYADRKAARGAANSIKRALRKQGAGSRMRLIGSDAEGFIFVLLPNE